MNTSPSTFPFTTQADDPGVLDLFRKGLVTLFLAQIKHIDLGFAGLMRCRLQLSVGDVIVSGNRETIPLSLGPGDWVQVRARRVYRDDPTPLHVLRMQKLETESKTAWLPSALCHRNAHLLRLRALLEKLSPATQAFFMTTMADPQVQRRFFWRVGACDHHCYPGGLFDQSVQAAEQAFAHPELGDMERSVAAMAALLFDVGKVFDGKLTRDEMRCRQLLLPHCLTSARLQRSYQAADLVQVGPGALLRAVLEVNPGSAIGGPPEVAHIAHCVRASVQRSFGLEMSPRL